MAAYPVIDNRYPPVFFRRFLEATLAAGAVTLHSTSAPNGTPPGLQAQYLPCQLIVEATAGDDLEITDISGTTVVLSFEATGTHVLRMAPVSIGGTAASTVTAVTVCWSQKG
jgi:sulfite exporter TauE/SafE